MRQRFLIFHLALGLCAGGLHASVVYTLRDARYFPDSPTGFNTFQSGNFTSTTSDSLPVSFSSNPGSPTANTFDGVAGVSTGPFTLQTHNAVTINTATTTTLGVLSIVQSEIEEFGL